MPANKDSMVGIDIGTTKVITLIGSLNKNNVLKIDGHGIYPCKGIKKGLVVDINEATRSILKSVEMAEASTKYFIDQAYIGITGKHISFTNRWSDIAINSPGNIVRKSDVDRLMHIANKVNLSPQNEVIHTLIKQFVIDDEKGIVDPIGLTANKLAVELMAVYGYTPLINNVVNSLKAAKIDIEDIILEALASGEAVLTPEEKESGVILLDLGGGTTDVAIYKDKKMIFTYCLPVAGDLITNDISIGLNITFSKAEEIKKKYANVDYNFYDTLNKANMNDLIINRNKTALNIKLYNIVNVRVKELLNLIKEQVESCRLLHAAPCGLVITGGTSQLKGICALAESVFGLPVRPGLPLEVEGPLEVINDPIYSTSVGILKYAGQMEDYLDNKTAEKGKEVSFLDRFRNFISRIIKN
ncbi:MAG: cell division protein FtsA [Actinobacteria bacterium]|nr:cell division protein FtsA [Actinomycetota bacterium]